MSSLAAMRSSELSTWYAVRAKDRVRGTVTARARDRDSARAS